MMWLLVFTFVSSGQITHEYSWHNTMGDCFEAWELKVEELGRPKINYHGQCVTVTEEEYVQFNGIYL